MDRCPTCGRLKSGFSEDPTELDPDKPGLLARLRGVNGAVDRWALTFVLVVLVTLFLVATSATFGFTL